MVIYPDLHFRLIPIFALSMLICTGIPGQRFKMVPKDFPTIQSAINSCIGGEMIMVSPGEYNELLTIHDKTMSIIAEDFAYERRDQLHRTVINAGGKGSAISVFGKLGTSVTLAGFTIKGGKGTEIDVWPGEMFFESNGGGVLLSGPTLNLRHCRFVNDSAESGGGVAVIAGALEMDSVFFDSCYAKNHGGALNLYSGSVNAKGCRFLSNASVADGGAVNASYSSGNVSFSNSEFISNLSAGQGGAISCRGSNLMIHQCRFGSNRSVTGGAIYLGTSGKNLSILRRSLFFANEASENGGAMYLNNSAEDSSVIEIRHCNFLGNKAASGGGLYLEFGHMRIANSIFSGNSGRDIFTSSSYGGYTGFDAIQILHNCFDESAVSDTDDSDPMPEEMPSEPGPDSPNPLGNLFGSPEFDPAFPGEYRLTINSICVDTGVILPPIPGFPPDETKAEDGNADKKVVPDIGMNEFIPEN